MTIRRSLLFSYRLLLRLYPYAFRQRFAPEMLELAEAAEPGEWPLIFSDTSLAIVQSWLKPPATGSTLAPAGQDAYLALGESALTPSRFLLGFVLSTAIIVGLAYAGSLSYLQLPKCHPIAAENVLQ
jgi:hypothetical protein